MGHPSRGRGGARGRPDHPPPGTCAAAGHGRRGGAGRVPVRGLPGADRSRSVKGPLLALRAIVAREALRFVHQRERFLAALVRPLVWLLVFAAGFRAALGLSITPPYSTYIEYETYIVPGLCGMILLFNGMQSSLSLVYDREMGSMRLLLTAPLPRWWLLLCKLLAGTLVGVLQAYAFLALAWVWGVRLPPLGYLAALPALVAAGLMLGALGLALSSRIRQLENFAGVMNFVIFPMFFLSSALYPLWRMQEAGRVLHTLCALNPFTHAVELVRFALYLQSNPAALLWTTLATLVLLALALRGYDPARGVVRKG
ncbi:multidrug ABC transporter permease [Rubellimicrobium rubrum]|uniref:Transport permease protein n=1 Tax=Rubellimicrobium rubrum TaxID=2585369 RepID=A0A5C4MR58_9RHOB|nr:multidrug ABC transporter permease [Rubellimicrobium rubrum]